MSNGPIQRERDGAKRPLVSTPDSKRVCMWWQTTDAKRSYCGRVNVSNPRVNRWEDVVCWDCCAAALADGVRLPKSTIERMPR